MIDVNNFFLMSDFYKQGHSNMYPSDMKFMTSYMTPRDSRIENKEVVVFGVQAMYRELLQENVEHTFFKRDIDEVISEIKLFLSSTFSDLDFSLKEKQLRDLHKLGFLPIQIKSLKEGTFCPIGVPFLEIQNTIEGYAWLVEYLETMISSYLWYPMVVATQAFNYKRIVNKYHKMSVDENSNFKKESAIAEFGFRGGKTISTSTIAGASFLTSFNRTASIPSILWLNKYYNCEDNYGEIGRGMISTEHSVMCSNIARIEDRDDCFETKAEVTFIKELLGKFPKGNISIVMDSYDYWTTLETLVSDYGVLCSLKERQGTLFVRGDSGNPVDVVVKTAEFLCETFKDEIYQNSKGYSVLPSYIRVIYGDSITPQRAEEIYHRLTELKISIENVSLGAGSFSMQCIEENGALKPFTRDTFGMAIKATMCKIGDKEYFIFKNPKEASFKKSQKGLVSVTKENGVLKATDCWKYSNGSFPFIKNKLRTVYYNGNSVKFTNLNKIRKKIEKYL